MPTFRTSSLFLLGAFHESGFGKLVDGGHSSEGRSEVFNATAVDGILEDNREDGRAWTLALLVPLGQSWRAGVEYLNLEVDRPAAVRVGSPPPDGDSVRAEVRYAF